jgi:predicted Ser/Thr protein kinase
MACLDAKAVQDLAAGALAGNARGDALAHVDGCAACRAQVERAAGTSPVQASLPRFSDDLALMATAAPALGETLLASDAPAGTAARMSPQDLLATPALRTPATSPPVQGKRLGRFTMTERLGAGAMGVVWRADDPNLGRNVALKILRHHDAHMTERLVREARSMAQVNHPNVVTVYEVGEADDGTAFIAMELVTGHSLRRWQTQAGRGVAEIVEAYIAAGRGLAAAHAAGIVHRDFKPDNVLVGDDGRVRVTDFGLAAAKPAERASATHLGDVNLTTSGSVLGTPAYMAPEQFAGGNVDSRTDQFNFCVALYEALYGERPFEGGSFGELADNVCAGNIRAAPPGTRVTRALRDILVRGLSVKPGDRFATMLDLIVELGRDRARPWRRTALAAGAVAVVLGAGLVVDRLVRDRLEREIRQSFALTGTQLERAVAQLTSQFDKVSAVAYREAALREVTGHHDQADFGLGTPEDDRAALESLHTTLASTDWLRLGTSEIAIVDYKGRLLFTSAAPSQWGSDARGLPPIQRALDAGTGDSITVLPYGDAAFVASGVLGGTRRDGLAVIFARTLALGDKQRGQSEARAIYLQVQDGRQLLEDVRLDDDTKLALVAPGGTLVGHPDITPALARAALAAGEVTEVDTDEHTYLVQARAVRGLAGQGTNTASAEVAALNARSGAAGPRSAPELIAHVVMARPKDGVLSLFPGARVAFVLTALAALGVALATLLRARAITGAGDSRTLARTRRRTSEC